jgi:hypothetical protein
MSFLINFAKGAKQNGMMSEALQEAHSEAVILHMLAKLGKLRVLRPPGEPPHYEEEEANEIRKLLTETRTGFCGPESPPYKWRTSK